MNPSTDTIATALEELHQLLDRHGIWHCVTYGTLLGAVRDGDIIPWDYDFDIFIRPTDIPAIEAALADAPHGFTIEPAILDGASLAVNPDRLRSFWGSHFKCYKDGVAVGDAYAFSLFDDGVLRRFDVAQDTYWCPHSSFPHFFVQALDSVSIRGRQYPAPRHSEKFLAGVYGEDWRTPYRAPMQGGEPREGTTTHGDRYEPKLAAEVQWCVELGWDRSSYSGELHWPRPIRAAGPIGPTDRTASTSRALWWRTLDELHTFY
ncbi:MAG TPA: LicD family protein [Vicinamibacterales bacterium]|nr:LicD family protein [Vicinamibacterales bacterium]